MKNEQDNVIHAAERFGHNRRLTNGATRHVISHVDFINREPNIIHEEPAYADMVRPIIARLEQIGFEDDALELKITCDRLFEEGENETFILKTAEKFLKKLNRPAYEAYIYKKMYPKGR